MMPDVLPARRHGSVPPPSRMRAASVLPASLADAIRTRVSSQSFVDAFDALLDRQQPDDPDPVVRPADRTVLRFLLTYRWCATRPTTREIAGRLRREERFVRASVFRLGRCRLLPWGDRL